MSFLFPSWDTAFSPAFHEDAKGMLEAALNKGNKPPVIQGRIEVVELSMGKEPPTLTLLEIGDLSLDRFRGILRLGYQGDAWLEVRCRVQANPLSHNPNLNPSSTLPLSTPLLASQPLLVPMTLRLSKLHLRAILILVVSKAKGITLVFKNDPLQNVDVSSTFDSVEVIRGYLQQEIEGQLREMFREDLPGIIHRLSQRWFTGTGVGGKVELQYKEQSDPSPSPQTPHDHLPLDDQEDDVFTQRPIFPPPVPSISPSVTPSKKKPPLTRIRRSSTAASESPTSYTVFPEIEEYDPTYGLRPEGVPSHSGYEAFGRLWEKARQGEGKGLGALMSISSAIQEKQEYRGDVSDGEDDYEDDGTRSFDMVEMEESLQSLKSPHLSRRNSRRSTIGDEDRVEWEMFPAVGGGVITRPRVYHSQSLIRAPSESGGNGIQPSPSGTATGGSITARASSIGGASSTIGSMRHPSAPVSPMTAFRPNALAGPGPSSLRRLVTTRSDVFQGHRATRSDVVGMGPNARSNNGNLSRRQSAVGTASSAARTSGSSWDTAPTRSNTLSTRATSAAPSSKPVSIDSKLLSPARNGATRDRSGSIAGTSPGKSFPPRQITLLPINNSVSQLATLSHSAHTLSPYARGHEHIAVRSFPHLGKTPMGYPHSNGFGSSGNLSAIAEGGQSQVRAHRKRIYHLGKKRQEDLGSDEPLSPDIDQFSPSARRPNERLENTNPERFPPSAYRGDVFDDSSPDKTSSSQVRTASLSGSRSTNSHSAHLTMQRKDKRPMSLTGTAQRVMAEDNGVRRGLATASVNSPRPNLSRSMDTRTSYGFPTLKGM